MTAKTKKQAAADLFKAADKEQDFFIKVDAAPEDLNKYKARQHGWYKSPSGQVVFIYGRVWSSLVDYHYEVVKYPKSDITIIKAIDLYRLIEEGKLTEVTA